MTCSTCGRENPAHLTFCQECGQRLGPRIAPPTPPIGLGPQDGYSAPPAIDVRAAVAPSVGVTSRPPAGTPTGERRCKVCDTVNPANLRYCTSCGSTLDPPTAPAPPPFPSVPPTPSREIAPMRVVDLSAKAAPAEPARICGRCRGTADAGAQFCKFCGNALGAGAPTPAPSPVVAHAHGNGSAARDGALDRPPTAPIAQVSGAAMRAMRPGSAPDLAPAPAASPIGPAAAPSNYGAPPAPTGAALLSNGPQPAAQQRPASRAPRPASIPPAAAAPSRSPAPTAQRGRLVVIAKSGADGPSYPFGDLLDVGRTEGNVIVGEDPYLSPRHVRIVFEGGRLILRDLGSTNGVFLRLAASRDITPRRSSESTEVVVSLTDQDVVLVGQQVIRFELLKEGEGGFGPAQEHGTLLFGSPAAPRYARLCQRTVEGISRDIYYIRKVETVLGRESGDVVFTEDPFLSRRHAAIRAVARDANPPGTSRPPTAETRFVLVDLGSSNGTFLRIRGDVELAPSDHFRVGQQLFRVDFDGASR